MHYIINFIWFKTIDENFSFLFDHFLIHVLVSSKPCQPSTVNRSHYVFLRIPEIDDTFRFLFVCLNLNRAEHGTKSIGSLVNQRAAWKRKEVQWRQHIGYWILNKNCSDHKTPNGRIIKKNTNKNRTEYSLKIECPRHVSLQLMVSVFLFQFSRFSFIRNMVLFFVSFILFWHNFKSLIYIKFP